MATETADLQLTSGQFSSLLRLLQGRADSALLYSPKTLGLAETACLQVASDSIKPSAGVRCLAGSWERRNDLCNELDCPFRGAEPVNILVKSNTKLNSYLVDPKNGHATSDADKPKLLWKWKNVEDAIMDGALAGPVLSIMQGEYAKHFDKLGIDISRCKRPEASFVVEHTNIRFLPVILQTLIPVDDITLDLVKCVEENNESGLMNYTYLLERSGYNIIQISRRWSMVQEVMRQIGKYRHSQNWFENLKKLYTYLLPVQFNSIKEYGDILNQIDFSKPPVEIIKKEKEVRTRSMKPITSVVGVTAAEEIPTVAYGGEEQILPVESVLAEEEQVLPIETEVIESPTNIGDELCEVHTTGAPLIEAKINVEPEDSLEQLPDQRAIKELIFKIYGEYFRVIKLVIPKIITHKFIVENTDIRFIALRSGQRIPVDQTTLDIVNSSIFLNSSEPDDELLAAQTNCTVKEVEARIKSVNYLVFELGLSGNARQRFKELKDDYYAQLNSNNVPIEIDSLQTAEV